MRTLMALLVLCVPLMASGQITFERTYGGISSDGGYSVAQTVDGGYIVTGFTVPFPAANRDVYLIKTDEAGDTVWTRTYGGSDDEDGYFVAQTADGGYIIAGRTQSFGAGAYDMYLIKTDGVGDTAWTRTFGGPIEDEARSVAQTADGGYIVAGFTGSFGAGARDVYLVKTDSSGDMVWTRTYGGSDDDYGSSVALTSDGGYIITGYTGSFGAGEYDVYLIKADGGGDTVWTRTYGGPGSDWGYSVAAGAGGYIIAGMTTSFGAGYYDVYLIKTDAAGDTVWTRTYGGLEWDSGHSVAPTADGGDIVTGFTESFGAGNDDVYLIKTNADGWVEVGGRDDVEPGRRLHYLSQNRPNPFGRATTISYAIPDHRQVSLAVYDIRGALVRELVSGTLSPGPHQVVWDGRDGRGREVGSGVYFCCLEAGETRETRRMVLLR